ncbi:MAG: DUF5615 family PIN-like protein [Verrucomicrobiota bacterium]|nr:DUF5615 family PIN-like protein [Verrucomicrobiota bacterium]
MDQNIPQEVAAWLREKYPTERIYHVNEIGLKGQTDPDIFRWAQLNQAIVVTYNEDFADARSFPLGSHCGVIRLRVWPTTVEKTQESLERLFNQVPESQLRGSLVIIDSGKIRLRRAILPK